LDDTARLVNTMEQLPDSITIHNSDIELTVGNGPSLVARLSVAGCKVADLLIPSSCNANGLPDFSYDISAPSVRQAGHETVVEVASSSALWRNKTYCFRLGNGWIEYYYTVEGYGVIDNCEFFQGFVGRNRPESALTPWAHGAPELGYWGRLRSKPYFRRVFNPEPNGLRKQYFRPGDYTTIGVRSDRSYCRGNWFFTPGPFCFTVETGSHLWTTLGLAARPAEHTFTRYDCSGGNGFGLSLSYEGHTSVHGRWESPHIVISGSTDEYEALSKYCDRVRRMEYSHLVPGDQFPWWPQPIFCGWGEQCYLSSLGNFMARASDLSTQSNYDQWLDALARQEVFPGTIVVDDKWQLAYGLCKPDPIKWPDMQDFIRRQHKADRRVLLWFKAWDPEGIPPDECVLDNKGQAVSVDPSNPRYERTLRREISLALDRLGADGFKIDFTAMHPPPGPFRTFSNLWGVELLKRLLWIIRDEAKKIKPDALIVAHTVNPYFIDVIDVVRLNDVAIIDGNESYTESMTHRQKVTRAVCPQLLIDTDNWPSPTVDSWLDYVREQPRLGIPSLYYATHIDESGEPLDAQCFEAIRTAWAEYRGTFTRNEPGIEVGA